MYLSNPRQVLSYAILLYMAVFGAVVFLWKPAIMFDEKAQARPFGVGYKQKTILPVWLFAVILGVLCYLAVLVAASYGI